MQNWQSDEIEVNGLRIHYYRTGGQLPQVVLNHGAMDDGLCWTRVAIALEDQYDLIMLDMRGHGKSDPGAGDYSTAARTADLVAAIESLDLDQPVIGGHSMGAVTSLNTAIERPDLVAGFFMEDPAISFPGEPLFGGESGRVTAVMYKGLVRSWKLFKRLPRSISLPLARRLVVDGPPEDLEPWLESKKRASDDFIEALEEPDKLLGDFDCALVDRVKKPAMLIYGERENGAIVSHHLAEELGHRIQGLQIVHLPGANHDMRRTNFEGYIGALESFLAEVLQS